MEHDLDQASLDRASAAFDLPRRGTWVAETVSTNTDLRRAAAEGASHGTFLVTDVQTGGRGRLGRVWEAPPGANICLSIVVRAGLPPSRLPLVSLLAAVVVAEVAGPSYRIKWPNDVLAADGRKVAGILAEVEGDALVVGIGVNVRAAPPLPTATALHDTRDRATLVAAIVRGLLDGIDGLRRDPAPILARWREGSHTLGRAVSVGEITGIAEDIDASGALLVRTARGLEKVLAGDVEMIGGRPA